MYGNRHVNLPFDPHNPLRGRSDWPPSRDEETEAQGCDS